MPADLSQDGTTLLLNEDGEGAGARPAIYFGARTAVRRFAWPRAGARHSRLTSSGCWRTSLGGGKPAHLVLLPTGPGEPKELPLEKLDPPLGRLHAGREARRLCAVGAGWRGVGSTFGKFRQARRAPSLRTASKRFMRT